MTRVALVGRRPFQDVLFLACDASFGFSARTNDKPRFSSAVRSVLAVATCTGLPDSLPSQAFNSSGVVVTKRPWLRSGIPSAAQRCTTEVGSPRNVAICCQPVSASGGGVFERRFFSFAMSIPLNPDHRHFRSSALACASRANVGKRDHRLSCSRLRLRVISARIGALFSCLGEFLLLGPARRDVVVHAILLLIRPFCVMSLSHGFGLMS